MNHFKLPMFKSKNLHILFCYAVCQVWKTSFRHIFRFVHLQSVKGFSRVERSHFSHLKDDHFKVVPLEQMGMVGLQTLHLAALSIQALPHLLHIEASLARALQQLGHAVGCGHVVLGERVTSPCTILTAPPPARPASLRIFCWFPALTRSSPPACRAEPSPWWRVTWLPEAWGWPGTWSPGGKGCGRGRGHRAGTEARNERSWPSWASWSWWCRVLSSLGKVAVLRSAWEESSPILESTLGFWMTGLD